VTNITFIFETSPNTKPKEKKVGDMAYYVPPSEKVRGTRPLCPRAGLKGTGALGNFYWRAPMT